MSEIIKFLQTENSRVSYGDKWLYWDEVSAMWVIMQQKYGQRTKTLEITDNEEKAIRILKSE